MTDVFSEFITPMLKVFAPPKVPDQGEFYALLTEDLIGFSTIRLQAAVRYMRRTRKFQTFPMPAECIEACHKGEDAPHAGHEPERRVYVLPWDIQPVDRAALDAARRRACARCRCALGQTADAEGWLPALIEFVIERERLPIEREVSALRGTARRAADVIDDIREGAKRANLDKLNVGYGLAPMVARFREVMLAKAHRDVFGDQERRVAVSEAAE